ncbi:MAG: hypothetical protein ABW051_00410 [Burkholderiaceae bacterium]
MRRLLLLFIAMLLPLQMTWAASHCYDHGIGPHEEAAVVQAAHAHAAGEFTAQDDGKSSPLAAAEPICCGTGAACHGSPLLPSTAAMNLVERANTGPALSTRHLKPDHPSRRHERPQWVPA